MHQNRSDRPWPLIDKCPNCSRQYSRRERASIGADEEYCCGWCKREAEAPAGHPENVRFHPGSVPAKEVSKP